MLEAIKNTEDIYDLMALCCQYLFEKIQLEYYEFWKFDEEKYNNVYDMIEAYTLDIGDIGHKGAYSRLQRAIVYWLQSEITSEKCHAIVKYIDELVKFEIENYAEQTSGFWSYSTLNNKLKNDVRIIPKMKDTFLQNEEGEFILKDPDNKEYSLFREGGECYASCIDEITNNYMIWDKVHLESFPVTIIKPYENSLLGKHFYHRKKITIGIVPFTCKELNNILNIIYSGDTFSVEGMHQDACEELKCRYKNIYKRSLDKDIDFLIYPEMLMTEDIINSVFMEGTEKNGPKFIVNGSIWNDNSNRAIITDLFGNKVFTYYKKCSFKYKDNQNDKKYKEALNCNINKEYVVLEIDGYGRIGVCICKDLSDENVLMFHKLINTNILLVPAFSDSFLLKNDAKNMAAKYNCLTVFANSCAAYCKHWKQNDEYNIGFVMIPAKIQTTNDCYMETYTAQKCYEFCEKECSCKMFTINFDTIKEYDDKMGIEIKQEEI